MLGQVEEAVQRRVAPEPIALTRIMLGIALGLLCFELTAAVSGISAGLLRYPYVSWAPSVPTWLGAVVLLVGLVSALLLVLGVYPHIVGAISCILCVTTLLADQQTYSNHLVLMILLLGLLTFSKSDRRWALSQKGHSGDSSVPFWPQLLFMSQVSACYLFAGLSKIQPTFLSGEPLKDWMWLDLPQTAFVGLAWATVVTEIGLAVLLWLPRWRGAAALIGVLLHVSIAVFLSHHWLALVSFALATMSAYPLFLTRPSLKSQTAPAAAAVQVSDGSSA